MLSAGAAFIIRDLLESGGPLGRAVESGAGIRRGIAWKTGTSFGFRDAWSVGVSDRYTIGVWVGRPDGTPNPGFFGANIAAPLLVDLFNALDAGPPTAPTADGVAGTHLLAPRQSRRRPTLRCATKPPGLDPQRRRPAHLPRPPAGASPLRNPGRCKNRPTGPGGLPFRRLKASKSPAGRPFSNRGWEKNCVSGPFREWAADCSQYARPDGGLKIVGAADGDILRRPTGADAPRLHLEVRGQAAKSCGWSMADRVPGAPPAPASISASSSPAAMTSPCWTTSDITIASVSACAEQPQK
jgi:penicillin-binding protein 1C